eukprot:1136952-Pelagomonas_calceolata.AAC.7
MSRMEAVFGVPRTYLKNGNILYWPWGCMELTLAPKMVFCVSAKVLLSFIWLGQTREHSKQMQPSHTCRPGHSCNSVWKLGKLSGSKQTYEPTQIPIQALQCCSSRAAPGNKKVNLQIGFGQTGTCRGAPGNI